MLIDPFYRCPLKVNVRLIAVGKIVTGLRCAKWIYSSIRILNRKLILFIMIELIFCFNS